MIAKTNRPDADTVICNAEPARVLRPGVANGSPSGFRYQYAHALDPDAALVSTPSQSALFPVFDATSSFEQPTINGYKGFKQSGRVYLIMRANDGDGASDDRLEDPYTVRLMTDEVDAGGGTPEQRKLRQQLVLTFYVNRAPYLDFSQPQFFPKPPEYNGGVTQTSPTRVLRINVPAVDPDPYDPANRPEPGGPSSTTVLRTQVTVKGTYTAGGVTRDTSYTAPRQFASTYTISLPAEASYITSTRVYVTIELCDCASCEQTPGTGRCLTYAPIPVDLPPAASDVMGGNPTSRPTGIDSDATPSRSLTP